jgi:hypothetical protein
VTGTTFESNLTMNSHFMLQEMRIERCMSNNGDINVNCLSDSFVHFCFSTVTENEFICLTFLILSIVIQFAFLEAPQQPYSKVIYF